MILANPEAEQTPCWVRVGAPPMQSTMIVPENRIASKPVHVNVLAVLCSLDELGHRSTLHFGQTLLVNVFLCEKCLHATRRTSQSWNTFLCEGHHIRTTRMAIKEASGQNVKGSGVGQAKIFIDLVGAGKGRLAIARGRLNTQEGIELVVELVSGRIRVHGHRTLTS